ncbi:hypothetical protein BKA67DRAFT_574303 [Truncatella angustata]|uniref:GRF-type domain-containing protein n=1 Tax=Truncatella angustata TaxID=152316 RepID=A0A9P8ZT06_9PEZI|nr:uncharacterized protein BKA67DRAFT_574303 [Truncatella angustata]KAH6648292.1 hypothetical protein BKA67DRAFT_574303 [Truncatella angustata]
MPSTKTTTFGISDSPTKKPTNGHFTKGQWLCNCKPRLPAVQFQVKRESRNKGRWFYTCQVDRTKGKTGEPARCDFFLWADDARLREEGAVLINSTTEPGGSSQDDGKKTSLRTPRKLVQTTLSARVEPREEGKRHWSHRTEITPIDELERAVGGSQNEHAQGAALGGGSGTAQNVSTIQATHSTSDTKTVDHDYGTSDMDTSDEDELGRIAESASKPTPHPTRTIREEQFQTPSAAAKRKRDVVDLEDDDLFGDMSSDEERQLVAVTDSTSQLSRSRDAFTTPAARRVADVAGGMPTPSLTDKSVRRVLFAEPEAGGSSNSNKRQRNDHAGGYTPVGGPTTPSSSQQAAGPSSSPATPGSGAGIAGITEEVMALLEGQKIDEQALKQVRSTLSKFAAKARGLEMGRDASRQALKKQDGKIAQLQSRITDLENRQKLDREVRKKMKSGLMHLYTET